jgi:hypothetical protein
MAGTSQDKPGHDAFMSRHSFSAHSAKVAKPNNSRDKSPNNT